MGFHLSMKPRIGRKHPNFPKIKIHIDGAAKGNPGLVGAGCMLRDSQGR